MTVPIGYSSTYIGADALSYERGGTSGACQSNRIRACRATPLPPLTRTVGRFRVMSYDIMLYRRDFLKRAVENDLEDWSDPDPFAEDTVRALIDAATLEGFVLTPIDEEFVAFTRAEGFEPGTEFVLDTSTLLAQLTVFAGEIAFSIPYGNRAELSVTHCIRLAKRMSANYGLAYYDPQEGEALYESSVA